MKKTIKTRLRGLLEPERRYWTLTVLTFIFLVVFSPRSWGPVLALWILNAVFGYRENRKSWIRWVHAAIGGILAIPFGINLIMWVRR